MACTWVVAGCGAGKDGPSLTANCGATGQICCQFGDPCGGGLACQAGLCAAGTQACGASGQACCTSGSACVSALTCQAGTCAAPAASEETTSASICAAGGTLQMAGATLTIPTGALTSCTRLTVSASAASPSGYTAYSKVFRFEPDGLALAKPATLSFTYSGDASLARAFWSRQGTTGYEDVTAGVAAQTVTAQVSRLGSGFVANGIDYTDPPDRSCVVGKLVEGRKVPPSTIALFFTVDDCWGRPLTGLTQTASHTDFSVLENGDAISPTEAAATILQRKGLQVFASLLIDMSASTKPLLPNVIDGAKAFVNSLQVAKGLPVQIDIQLFAGGADITQWQAPTLDTPTLQKKLEDLKSFVPTDSATNLNGAVVKALDRLATAESTFRGRNYGGAFTTGYLVVFTDGKDTAARVTADAATAAEALSADQVIGVGLKSGEYDADALTKLAPNGVVTATDVSQLPYAFAALANRMAGQVDRTYLLGYCSPKRGGTDNIVSVAVTGATQKVFPTYKFDASAFAPGCSTDTFSTVCNGKQCGGLGCGACDDRLAACDQTSSLCVDNCVAQHVCGGAKLTNAQGYEQTCADTQANMSCASACVDTTSDSSNCGGCGVVCGGGTHCAAARCVP